MPTLTHRRHDISDEVWAKIEPHLPGRKGSWGGIAGDNRSFINAVFGLCAPALRGETFRRILVDGAIPTVGLSGGVMAVCGSVCWKY